MDRSQQLDALARAGVQFYRERSLRMPWQDLHVQIDAAEAADQDQLLLKEPGAEALLPAGDLAEAAALAEGKPTKPASLAIHRLKEQGFQFQAVTGGAIGAWAAVQALEANQPLKLQGKASFTLQPEQATKAAQFYTEPDDRAKVLTQLEGQYGFTGSNGNSLNACQAWLDEGASLGKNGKIWLSMKELDLEHPKEQLSALGELRKTVSAQTSLKALPIWREARPDVLALAECGGSPEEKAALARLGFPKLPDGRLKDFSTQLCDTASWLAVAREGGRLTPELLGKISNPKDALFLASQLGVPTGVLAAFQASSASDAAKAIAVKQLLGGNSGPEQILALSKKLKEDLKDPGWTDAKILLKCALDSLKSEPRYERVTRIADQCEALKHDGSTVRLYEALLRKPCSDDRSLAALGDRVAADLSITTYSDAGPDASKASKAFLKELNAPFILDIPKLNYATSRLIVHRQALQRLQIGPLDAATLGLRASEAVRAQKYDKACDDAALIGSHLMAQLGGPVVGELKHPGSRVKLQEAFFAEGGKDLARLGLKVSQEVRNSGVDNAYSDARIIGKAIVDRLAQNEPSSVAGVVSKIADLNCSGSYTEIYETAMANPEKLDAAGLGVVGATLVEALSKKGWEKSHEDAWRCGRAFLQGDPVALKLAKPGDLKHWTSWHEFYKTALRGVGRPANEVGLEISQNVRGVGQENSWIDASTIGRLYVGTLETPSGRAVSRFEGNKHSGSRVRAQELVLENPQATSLELSRLVKGLGYENSWKDASLLDRELLKEQGCKLLDGVETHNSGALVLAAEELFAQPTDLASSGAGLSETIRNQKWKEHTWDDAEKIGLAFLKACEAPATAAWKGAGKLHHQGSRVMLQEGILRGMQADGPRELGQAGVRTLIAVRARNYANSFEDACSAVQGFVQALPTDSLGADLCAMGAVLPFEARAAVYEKALTEVTPATPGKTAARALQLIKDLGLPGELAAKTLVARLTDRLEPPEVKERVQGSQDAVRNLELIASAETLYKQKGANGSVEATEEYVQINGQRVKVRK